MANKKIKDLPQLKDITDDIKLPTGGAGDYAVTIAQLKQLILQYVPNGKVEDGSKEAINGSQLLAVINSIKTLEELSKQLKRTSQMNGDYSPLLNETDKTFIVDSVVTLDKSAEVVAKLAFENGGLLKVTNSSTLSLNNVLAIDNQKIISYPATCHVSFKNTPRVSMGWFDNTDEQSGDYGYIVNDLINSSDNNGRVIYFPNKDYLIKRPINLIDKSFITLYGDGYGQKSNIEYEKKPPFGNGLVTTYPSSGAKLMLHKDSSNIVFRGTSTNRGFRSSGICIKGLTFSGHNSPSVAQAGIRIEEDNDGYMIQDNVFINFRGFGLFIKGNDAMTIRGNWVCECENPLYIQGGKESMIQNNMFGAFPTGISCDIQEQVRLNFSGNNIPPDGSVGLNLNKVRHSLFNNNVITGRFTGLVYILGSYCNIFGGNILKIPQDEETSANSKDPKNRGVDYGVLRIEQSDDNIISDTQILAYLDSNKGVTINLIKSKNNILSNVRITNKIHSDDTVVISKDSPTNQLFNVCRKTELNDLAEHTDILAYRA